MTLNCRLLKSPKNYLLSDSKTENACFERKKVVLFLIFQYFDILIGMSALMNQTCRSILAIRNQFWLLSDTYRVL